MVKIKGFIKVILMVIIIFISGCAEYVQVPNGNVAKRKTEAGLEAKIYTAGAIDVWDWWDKKTLFVLSLLKLR